MKYKRIIKKVLSENRPYNPNYPEHKPINQKLSDMDLRGKTSEEYLLENIIRNKKYIPSKGKQFREPLRSKCKNEFEFIYEVLHWNLEFDITEDYIWNMAAQKMDDPEYQKREAAFIKELMGMKNIDI